VPQYGRRVTDVLKGMLRPALIPAPGKSFVVADWSSIEARVTPWCSGEAGEDKLTLFRDGADVYKVNAAATFRCRVEDVTKDQRQVGKVQELACLAEDTLVLTDNGWKVIQEVTQLDALWDGEAWVMHQGIIPRGVKPTVNVAGIAATPDHLFLAANEWAEAQQLVSNEKYRLQALATGLESLRSLGTKSDLLEVYNMPSRSARAALPLTASPLTILEKALQRGAMRALKKPLDIGPKISMRMRACAQMTRIDAGFLIVCPPAKTGATTQTTGGIQITAGEVFAFMNHGVPTKLRSLLTSCRWTVGISRAWNWIVSTSIKGTNPATCVSSQSATTATTNAASSKCSGTSSNLRRVYDIAYAGPRNRFTVLSEQGPLITHNCGFAGGVGAFAAMGRVYGLSLPESEARQMVDAWRRANPWSVPYWQDLEIAYTRAIRNPKTKIQAGRVSYYYDGLHLWYALPSGRVLCYPYARIEEEGVTYAKASWKPAADAKEWPRARLWKGLACENITQATAADILRHALREIPDVVLHIHDEVVVETDQPDAALEHMQRVMGTPPAWAAGLPLAAEASVMTRYGK
jgi:DNA polymerase